MEIISTKDMRLLDKIAMEEYKIPSLKLMEQAAACVKTYIDEHFDKTDAILIVCGPGNNGGDGFALALQLYKDQYQYIKVVCCVPFDKMSQDEYYYASKVQKANIQIIDAMDMEVLHNLFHQQDVLVDALFGTGLSREISGYYKMLITAMNGVHKSIISIDMPSGIHADTGCIMGCAIKATVCITFECAKYGQFIYPGSEHCGNLFVKHIGIPKTALHSLEHYPILNDEYVRHILVKRKSHSHKGTYGKALLIGGSTSMHGAITLCAKSMLRSGVGMLTLFIPHDIVSIVSMKMEECMLLDAPCEEGYFSKAAVELLKERIQDYDTIIIGNGMGRHPVGEELVKLVLTSNIPCVIDGDGIYECAKHLDLLKERTHAVILTPHPKEMSYLSKKSVDEITQNPFETAKEFAKAYPCVTLVLKDQYSIITDGISLCLNTTGNHALAKGGSGDVLCGIISGLFAQSKDAMNASASGVYVHGKCAVELCRMEDENSILPSDLILTLSSIYKSLR